MIISAKSRRPYRWVYFVIGLTIGSTLLLVILSAMLPVWFGTNETGELILPIVEQDKELLLSENALRTSAGVLSVQFLAQVDEPYVLLIMRVDARSNGLEITSGSGWSQEDNAKLASVVETMRAAVPKYPRNVWWDPNIGTSNDQVWTRVARDHSQLTLLIRHGTNGGTTCFLSRVELEGELSNVLLTTVRKYPVRGGYPSQLGKYEGQWKPTK